MHQTEGCFILLRRTTPDDAPVICRAYQNKAFLRLFAAHRKIPESEEELRHSLQKRTPIFPVTLHYIESIISSVIKQKHHSVAKKYCPTTI